ncbi:MAG: TetR/AcrR family transcriptional regulator [Sphingomonas sp.]|uniref:TetR/AcrR family transcriptional regulator n=1 Tax=Sphingomonas sp. TaxID=28214 RepID=UPI0017EB03D0|nr:TetR/AcrR family transcriptional regulator [Sphingomonas sp.]MBA3666620.1 TetR/AcrR family transcriptional regulator [Sphingomonas sp.]
MAKQLTPHSRVEQAKARNDAILAAALVEFVANGFAATRIDDVAKRAGVAKGTVFHHFTDKERLFESMARAVLQPWVDRIDQLVPAPDMLIRSVIEAFLTPLVEEIATPRGDVLRLFISEGMRFPRLADFYHGEILSKLFGRLRPLLRIAAARGELCNPGIAELPQLIGAPIVVGVLWHGLFQRIEPLDHSALLKVQLDCLFVGKDRG